MPRLRRLSNIGYLATCRAEGGQGDAHPIRNATVVWEAGKIVWAGPESELPAEYRDAESWDAGARLVVPGLVDCHTHLCFGGWRADEFELRILGRSYLDIAKAGGGIASTLKRTREASEEALVERGAGFLREIAKLGVTTVECKSGYGLSLEDELKLLRAYRALSGRQPLTLVSTLLAAHIVPPEYKHNREEYIRIVIEEIIPAAAREKLAAFCDVFMEETAFTAEETRKILECGLRHGLLPKLHADQLSDGGGARLAAELGAASADHLERISAEGIAAMAEAGTVAVMLPIATLYTHQPPLDARRLIDGGVPVAVASDFNPGSAPSYHLPLAMMLACTTNRMTPLEVLKGATILAARAIGLESRLGSIEPGKAADLAVIDAADPNHWLYHFTANACVMTVKGGERL